MNKRRSLLLRDLLKTTRTHSCLPFDPKIAVRVVRDRFRLASAQVTYDSESRDGHFCCAFCGEKQSMRYRDDGLDIPRLHWGTCHGIVGFEQLVVEIVDLTDTEKSTQVIVDLSVKHDRFS